tara:strand:- start:2279 stop:2743 length:465 start_codon:yes stop_codon:yes gene_type:complete
MNKDTLVEGPFGSNACYEQSFEQDGKEVKTWMCFGSGFSTSTFMNKDSDLVKKTLETSPELYKDLMHIDKNDKAWFPATITLPEKGMVFADGTSKDDWKWAAVKAVPITEEDRKVKQFPADQKFKMDMDNKSLHKTGDFMDALEQIGFFSIQPE